ncbi:VOC family protein [Sinomonas sp. G460-2]|uniref:VOC family protein n=1 Tax=Sinomonas sp. G460-2 TaxID=3393464 RepID=UPI0039F0F7ED
MTHSTKLGQAYVYTTIPAQDLVRARQFYAEKLGLEPLEESAEGLTYELAEGSQFLLFPSTGKASGDHTQIAFRTADIGATVGELRSRGVEFEDYDLPSLRTVEGIAERSGLRAAWFRDSEGNLLGVAQMD